MDCRLSVLEEMELHYILCNVTYSSPLIDEVRMMMGVALQSRKLRRVPSKAARPKVLRPSFYIGIAATVMLLLGVALSLYKGANGMMPMDEDVCIAYAGGVEITGRQGLQQIEADIRKADAFMNYFAQIEAAEEERFENFMNITSK